MGRANAIGAASPMSEADLAAAFARRLGRPGARLSRPEAAFIALSYEDYSPDELADLTTDDLAAVLHSLWSFAQPRKPGALRVRLSPAKGADGRALGLDLLELAQDDAPFLVDSIMAGLGGLGVSVRAMFHPQVAMERAAQKAPAEALRDSLIQVVLTSVAEDRRALVLKSVREIVADVRAAVGDFAAMTRLMSRSIAALERDAPANDPEALAEHLAFLRWLQADRFVFLGARAYQYPRTADGGYEAQAPMSQTGQGLGVLRDPALAVLRRTNEPAVLSPGVRRHIEADAPLAVAKANLKSRVHRQAYMDYIGVKQYGPDGKPSGEVRFVGLFTSEAYEEPAEAVPLIRRKLARVADRAGRPADSHSARQFRNILQTYPRDELFQIGEDDLLRIARGIMHLYGRPRVRLFARKDPFDRFVSVLMFVPRERYDADLRDRAGQILAVAWGGRVSASYPSYSDSPLARTHIIIGLTPGDHRSPDMAAVEAKIALAARTWGDAFEDAVRKTRPGAAAGPLLARYRAAFPPGYRDQFDASEALADIAVIESLDADEAIRVRAYRRPDDPERSFRLKLYHRGDAVPLSDILPIVEAMGLRATVEHGFPIQPGDKTEALSPVWAHELTVLNPPGGGQALDFERIREPFETTFTAIWNGKTENDGFNRLVLELAISWRDAALIRALARYRQQSGLDPSQAVQEAALRDFPEITGLILQMVQVKFDPRLKLTVPARRRRAEALFAKVLEGLQGVASLDADRVLRRLALLARALQRTNFYQPAEDGGPKDYISFKVASRELDDLPLPKPYREIFVWAPHVEGVHLRFGPVARGGLRWSDRRDDFRTEVLGLAKAQQVKNAVIVPVGAKGGFYPKALPRGGSAEAIRAEGVRAYRTYLSALLDITDNRNAQGEVVPPPHVVRHDGDDPYLVVAADKGTATFSDIANGVAESYGFWLGDAFASGGSAGYDHKAMGITARGAWEAVKRHFREMGKDIQAEPFTVVGVGDMSGDVFGNGMLLSKQIRLVAAFDHRHIFVDPAPDPAASWEERNRLFALPRSSWADYDAAVLSEGGAIFPRAAKTIAVSPQVRALLGLTADILAPVDLIRAILRHDAELLYLGGIGTYVKGPMESHADVGDKANDAIRVDGGELRFKVVGEGANLGFTQAGRIAYARFGADGEGGRIDTDAIDNSAGVDTSDHEVNIKILTRAAEAAGRLKRPARDRLLRSMTQTVGEHVLAHNYDQTLALTLQQSSAARDLTAHARFMSDLVQAGRLDRQVEGLPSPAALADLAKSSKGLTRPELAVLLAYGKLELSSDIVASDAPDDPYFESALAAYFPKALAPFQAEMAAHPLRRDIIATVLANDIVNLGGATFPDRLRSAAACDTRDLVMAFEGARRVFRLDEIWREIAALDAKVPASVQTDLFNAVALALRRQTFWLARRTLGAKTGVQSLVQTYRPAADALMAAGPALLSHFDQQALTHQIQTLVQAGAPAALAARVVLLRPLTTASDIADLARRAKWSVEATGRLYHQAGSAFGFDRLRAGAGALAGGDEFEQRAVRRLIEDLLTEQDYLVSSLMAEAASPKAGQTAAGVDKLIRTWIDKRDEPVRAARDTLDAVLASESGWSFAKLTIANGALRELTGAI